MISTQRSDVTFFGISKSISSVSGSAAKVNDIVSQINQKSIRSCVIGASSITGYSINHNIVHTALLLSEKKANTLERKGGTGILIEYGDYSQDIDEQEKNYVKNKVVSTGANFCLNMITWWNNTFNRNEGGASSDF